MRGHGSSLWGFPDNIFIVEITHDKRGVMQGFTTHSDISNTKAKPECF